MAVITLAWSFLLLELLVRAYFAVRTDQDVLLWGTRWYRDHVQQTYMLGQNVFQHDNIQGGYSKYFPNQRRSDVDHEGVPFAVTINRSGFRGADYEAEKVVGTLRILTLGASSTFGFGNRDDETYPYILEQLLNERFRANRCGRYTRAEVINLGIPHLDARSVAELFAAEGLGLQPDAVTVYSAYNNTRGLGQSATLNNWSRHWLVVNFVRVARLQGQQVSESQLHKEIEARTASFIAGMQGILDVARVRDIAVLPITQQVRALPAEIIHQQHITYQDEMEMMELQLQTRGSLALLEGKILVHQSLTRALHRWAQHNHLELIDAIELLDDHRYLLTSYVHLAPLANELIALAIADRVAMQFDCPLNMTDPGI